ncbi:DUF1648 domain-containing protein [Corynebacterium lehmanniae]|uniref:DUF1648 domain-containing protein n=1 Tax=Corynebacterium haemomassiliense TaxID=2754726 RepID=UPI00370D0970
MPSHYRRYGLAALIYAAGFAYILLRWDAIPDPVTVHIGPTGEADGFAPKTLLSTTLPMIIGIAVTLILPLFLPPRSLARHTVDVPADGALPFSETVARRVEKLCDASADVVSKIILAMAALLAVMNIAMVVPDVSLPFWLEIVLWIGFIIYVVVIGMRVTSKRTGSNRTRTNRPATSSCATRAAWAPIRRRTTLWSPRCCRRTRARSR